MADVSAIRAALRSRLLTLVGNDGDAYTYWQQEPHTPSFMISAIGPTDYDSTFGRGSDNITITITATTSSGLDEAAQRQIDDWCDTSGSTSVKAALETERPAAVTLGGLVSACRVTGHTEPRPVVLKNGTEAWQVDFTLTLIT